jgi:hypothetical protein
MTTPPDPVREGPLAAAFYWRLLPWLVLIPGWLYMLLHLWSAFATFPAAERLEHSRLVAIPTLSSLAVLGLRSALELAAVLALTWPWSSRLWVARVWTAAMGLAVYFIVTAPLGVSAMTWVHRRWLAAMAVGLAAVAIAALGARLTQFAARRLFPR